jgi:hypothetical protein
MRGFEPIMTALLGKHVMEKLGMLQGSLVCKTIGNLSTQTVRRTFYVHLQPRGMISQSRQRTELKFRTGSVTQLNRQFLRNVRPPARHGTLRTSVIWIVRSMP